ncbi:hypothetical protein [Kribbia dieselivorans]|uniref:hypothetical protein n=1 Tax=Kribbia dieselivorans TaxID=331526 RepID=UPI000838DF17|nr:hypothetical protein [Kribbia dieselivorans]
MERPEQLSNLKVLAQMVRALNRFEDHEIPSRRINSQIFGAQTGPASTLRPATTGASHHPQ